MYLYFNNVIEKMRRRRQWRTTLCYNHDIIINRKYVSSVTLEFRFKLSKLFKYLFQSLFISYSSHKLRIMRSQTFAFFKTFAVHDTLLISPESASEAHKEYHCIYTRNMFPLSKYVFDLCFVPTYGEFSNSFKVEDVRVSLTFSVWHNVGYE